MLHHGLLLVLGLLFAVSLLTLLGTRLRGGLFLSNREHSFLDYKLRLQAYGVWSSSSSAWNCQ